MSTTSISITFLPGLRGSVVEKEPSLLTLMLRLPMVSATCPAPPATLPLRVVSSGFERRVALSSSGNSSDIFRGVLSFLTITYVLVSTWPELSLAVTVILFLPASNLTI
ncbi:hypothetical protein MBAV_003816 [Candidatus Magnetobacterium bavaricum]|uniref:Uncharacterized protein n=1 Tax=Candidatus Magnetobacterium bavaricum TaxID=29290 RepID=A0A0F3GTH8_9BACT|nr:hypothetical protein MBAV_003816 [Candidatus Magnetobacterium bavaricum]